MVEWHTTFSDPPTPHFYYRFNNKYIVGENDWIDLIPIPCLTKSIVTRNTCLLNKQACQFHKPAELILWFCGH